MGGYPRWESYHQRAARSGGSPRLLPVRWSPALPSKGLLSQSPPLILACIVYWQAWEISWVLSPVQRPGRKWNISPCWRDPRFEELMAHLAPRAWVYGC